MPRWAAVAAHTVPYAVLPSGLWRLALVAGLPVTRDAGVGSLGLGTSGYAVGLTLVSELLAFLTLGLVRPWGEVFPRRLPLLGGRRVAPAGATGAALAGAVALCGVAAWGAYARYAGLGPHIPVSPSQRAVLVACYAPLLAWPPLLAAVAVAYRRRRGSERTPAPG
ncbi:hypothetical protein AB0C52_15095 [Streptomyces sp. NPDC048717]|uniref:hypothetical protein n=1 Tax=Streptomyces sp. NPDC048717 TaxID=3154928 RepID=UPI00341BA4C8